ncbi:SCO family protein [Winogradskyella sp. Asnod2-B02-A]|uniref:SCO family protein n=1 Tax=Winogradskyella sp. Asnod2-B02-A TaxID=3160583 RepID=UPI00386EBB28
MRLQICLLILLCIGCQPNVEELPILSYKINTKNEKEFYTVSYSKFINQDEEKVTTKTINNKIVIANFFFTRCPSICPPMRTKLIDISKTFINDDAVILISHSIDPKNDTIEVLKKYSEATGIPNSKWMFVRSTEKNTKALASQLMTNFKPNEAGTDFYHSSYIAILDQNQNIRGFYNSLIPEEVTRLKKDIKLLLAAIN